MFSPPLLSSGIYILYTYMFFSLVNYHVLLNVNQVSLEAYVSSSSCACILLLCILLLTCLLNVNQVSLEAHIWSEALQEAKRDALVCLSV